MDAIVFNLTYSKKLLRPKAKTIAYGNSLTFFRAKLVGIAVILVERMFPYLPRLASHALVRSNSTHVILC